MVTLSAAPPVSVPEVDAATLAAWLADGSAIAIDVREDEEWEEMRLTQAHLLPMSEFEPEDLPDVAGRKVVVLCRAGVRSLAVARRILQRTDLDAVYNLTGGILAWHEAGLPVETGAHQERAA